MVEAVNNTGRAAAYYAASVTQIETYMATILSVNSTDDRKVIAAIELLLKLTQNITKSPSESKFRTIRATIPKIQNTLFALGGCIPELIQALGFLKIDDEHYVFVGDFFKVLKRGQSLLEKAIEPLKVKYMSPEERQKWEQIQQSKMLYKEEQRKKKELVEQAKRMANADRIEKAQEGPARASIAN